MNMKRKVAFNRGQSSERVAVMKRNKVGMESVVVGGKELHVASMAEVKALDPIKQMVEDGINFVHEHEKDAIVPYTQLFPPVKAIHKAFERLIRVEPDPRMRARWAKFRDLVCSFLNKDNAYRLRLQMFVIDFLDLDALRLTDPEMKLLAQKINVKEVIKIVGDIRSAQLQKDEQKSKEDK